MRLSRGARRLLDLLKWFYRRFGRSFPNQDRLRKLLNCGLRSVKRWLSELVRTGLVLVQRRYRRSNEYTFPQAQTTAPKQVGPIVGPTVVNPCSPTVLRREIPSPLVIFRDVYRRVAHKKPKAEPMSLYDRLKAQGYKGFV